ncbi:dipeptide ABC transporter ATP-binding protein [Dinghuibacter silviterrae]|uniref:Peptide/nickel transport system ATP-binding protein n=1 Tax=Dinghuibacter silviterrae TaxID=1539049 RepID=A0A4R8DED1_9BACT|nr:ABC transporter ATP-binding protein [Dinghuibacter silviterrae]TDW95785.1 peptide/nickel transport system ATP-binding protein [Dinghuibacter silviterrae]
MPLLRIQHLQATFPGQPQPALQDISLDIDRGEWVALVGESGSGKSVTALSVLGLIPQARYPSGAILLERPSGGAAAGADPQVQAPTGAPPTLDLLHAAPDTLRHIRGREVSMIFQEPMTSLNPVFTCGFQIAETLRTHLGLTAREAKERAREALADVLLQDVLYDRYPHQLSGGQKQRVMIAMAICCRPALLIADEPTTALDVTVQQGIIQLLKNLQQKRNMGVLFITHDLELVRSVADRVLVMYRGRLLEEGPVPGVLDAPRHPYTKALLACRPGHTPKGQRLPVVEDFWREEGTAPPPMPPKTVPEPPKAKTIPLLRAEDLKVWFPGKNALFAKPHPPVKAVDGVSLTVHEGEILGLVGGSGSGKTTLGRALMRLVDPTGGKVFFRGEDLTVLGQRALRPYRRQAQIVFQDPYSALNPRMTIGRALGEVAGPGHVPGLLEQVRLPAAFAGRYPHECSGGQRQRAVIARALAVQPRFILFDESVSALDVSVQAQILNLIGDLKRELGFTAVFISHDPEVVRYLCDRVIAMKAGRIETD